MCVCVSGHQSVYISRIIIWWDSNPMQRILLNLGSVHPPGTFNPPPTTNMHARDEKNEGQTMGTFMTTSVDNHVNM